MEKISIEYIEDVSNIQPESIYNINIGILGHVDSGKTSIAKTLSLVSSTAAFDKNPQSKERGITLDLGFSAFYIKTPEHIKEKFKENSRLQASEVIQVTLVDCPGHASLIKTVLAGAYIIDMILLVIDGVKGIQPQTTECVILAEILTDNIIIALNKIDLLEDPNTKADKIQSLFKATKFGASVPIIPFSTMMDKDSVFLMKIRLIEALLSKIDFNKRNQISKNFLFSIDHCFAIKNKGTIITGTILEGSISVNDEIFFPELSEKKTVKELQMFRKPIKTAHCGDRLGMLIKNLDPNKIERSLACNFGYVRSFEGGIFELNRIKHFKFEIKTNSKMFIILGNHGVMAKCLYFKHAQMDFNLNKYDFEYLEEFKDPKVFALVRFDSRIFIPPNTIALGSKIDFDVSYKSNRLAFFGKLIDSLENIGNLKIFKEKMKEGKILRMNSETQATVVDLFKKDSNVEDYIGRKVKIGGTEIYGVIQSKFGQSGKVKVEFEKNVKDLLIKNNDGEEIGFDKFVIELHYKKYIKLNKF